MAEIEDHQRQLALQSLEDGVPRPCANHIASLNSTIPQVNNVLVILAEDPLFIISFHDEGPERHAISNTVDRTLTEGPKYVNGKRSVAKEVETLPSASVMRVEDKVSQDGSCWDG